MRILPIGVFFFIWLFFAGLALAEQVGLMVETSQYDEQALIELGQALKPQVDKTTLAGHSVVHPTEIVRTSSIPHRVEVQELHANSSLLEVHEALDLYMLHSAYRI